jgi:Spy/CpxP family protein refolding chaperone
MKTGWKTRIVIGAVFIITCSQVLAQPQGGQGRGPRHAAGPGAGFVPHAPGPMGVGPGGGGPFCDPLGPAPGGLLRLGWWLDLTEEQTRQIKAIYEKAQADANAVADAVVHAREALHKAVVAGVAEEQIRAAATALGTAIGNQAALEVKTLASAKAVLTEEQRKEFEKIQAKLAPPQHRRGPMAGGAPGGGPHGPNPGAGGPPGWRVPHRP